MKIHPVEAEFIHADGRTDRWIDRRADRLDEANNCESALQLNNFVTILSVPVARLFE